jgi:hypothetical protein
MRHCVGTILQPQFDTGVLHGCHFLHSKLPPLDGKEGNAEMTHRKDGGELDARILRLAALPGGFSPAMSDRESNARVRCWDMVAAGTLFRAQQSRQMVRYFTDKSAAEQFALDGLEESKKTPKRSKELSAKIISSPHAEVFRPKAVETQYVPCAPYKRFDPHTDLCPSRFSNTRTTCHAKLAG